jgi:DNA modification methylase
MIEDCRLMLGDCLERMQEIESGYVDLTVTSPPYDNLRTYNDSLDWGEHVWRPVIEDLYRITKQGGVVVWVVGDATIKGSETGTSFKQALWAMECGFNLHDTMIYHKANPIPLTHNRYEQSFEYMFIFSKRKITTFNPLLEACKAKGSKTKGRTFYQTNDQNSPTVAHKNNVVNDYKQKSNIWAMATNAGAKGHPAQFPEKLAHDHIISWSNEGDTVLDCFMGSGTTGAACVKTGRKFIGIEKDESYFEIAKSRIEKARAEYQPELFETLKI